MNQRTDGPSSNQFRIIAGAFLGLLLIGGCATTPNTTATSAASTATSTAAPAPLPSQPVSITERANHSTVKLRIGQLAQVSLASTYWSNPVSSSPTVVAADGPVTRLASGRCPIGVGCGTVSLRLRAAGAGTALVRADRSSCGEAMRCAPDQQQFTVTIVVS